MTILLKFPTRGRPVQFLKTLRGWLEAASDPSKLAVLVSYDVDDATMTPEVVAEAEKLHPAVVCVKGNSKSKIEACNADLNEHGGTWDVCLLVSDDFWCRRKDWDDVIRREMDIHYPGHTDGALWFFDGSQKLINTLECVGKGYWSRRRYLYHHDYRSFWCDNEATVVGLRDGKLPFISHPIASHEHPSWAGGMRRDETYQRNNKFWREDEATFNRRKAIGFPQ